MLKLRIIAYFLLITMVNSIMAPTLVYALTSGPTAPEYNGFEPIEASDMVNLNTGDFIYNIPLMEVPGPEGGYPVALSYHAAISPEEDASWVGLGWNLNVGAINRMVNGVPDDINRSSNFVHDTWSGGEQRSTSVSAGVGLGAGIGIEAGVTVANDTYKGVGVGGNVGIGVSIGNTASVGFKMGINPYGEGGYVGLMAGVGSSGSGTNAALSAGLIASWDGNGVSTLSAVGGLGVTAGPYSIVGMSMMANDKGSSASASIGGISGSALNSKVNNLSITTASWALTIPVWYYFYVAIGRSKTRYYLDQLDPTPVYGSLYGSQIDPDTDFTLNAYDIKEPNVSYDCYAMSPLGAQYEADQDKEIGGSMPAYDNYFVSAQGVGGSIQPYIFEQGALFRKGETIFSYDYNPFTNPVGFRFTNDFSNSFTRDGYRSPYTDVYSYASNITSAVGEEGKEFDDPTNKDFNIETGILAGSRHVEWFTNKQINEYSDLVELKSDEGPHAPIAWDNTQLKGFIPSYDQRKSINISGQYGLNAEDNIGGFMVTNESGVSYHYSIPVYNFNELSQYSTNAQGQYSRTITKDFPYAYAWLLTAVTGPDYIDRYPFGQVDENDWGYWVKFEYGKWTDQYNWRTPTEGADKDFESSTLMYSTGRKELYYLDAIKTRSHTALFVKDIRNDGKGVGSQMAGGYNVELNPANFSIQSMPASTMQLKKILLYTNKSLKDAFSKINNVTGDLGISTVAELKRQSQTLKHVFPNASGGLVTMHNGEDVLDEYDLNEAQTHISEVAIKQYKFNHSYDLCPGTPNSFKMEYKNPATLYQKTNLNGGKLTLLSVETLGWKGKSIIPSTKFDYALKSTPYRKGATDVWGMYKSDFVYESDYIDQRTSQIATAASAPNKQAWSLNKITTPMGAQIKIEYESDVINTNVLMDKKNIAIASIVPHTIPNQYKINLYSSENVGNIPELTAGNQANLHLLFKHQQGNNPNQSQVAPKENIYNDNAIKVNVEVVSQFDAKTLIVEDKTPDLLIGQRLGTTYVGGPIVDNNPTYFLFGSGNLIFDANTVQSSYGGDLRVKSIALKSGNRENITTYTYLNGTTSYEPIDFKMYITSDILNSFVFYRNDIINKYRNEIFKLYTEILANTSFLPPPGVMYESVIVQDRVRHHASNADYLEINGEGSTKYLFSVFNRSMMPRSEDQIRVVTEGQVEKTITFKDLRSRVGLLLSTTQYTGFNATGQMISKVENNYLHTASNDYENELENNYNNQGRIDQVFFELKNTHNNIIALQITSIEDHPIVATGSKLYDYKKGGITEETKILAYDYFSGAATSTLTSDAWGNYFMNEVVPAYRVDQYSEMGHRVKNAAHKHMLTQQAASSVYKVVPNQENPSIAAHFSKVGLVSANVNLWSKDKVTYASPTSLLANHPVWKSAGVSQWVGNEQMGLSPDGTVSMLDFTPFNFDSPLNNPSWLSLYGTVTNVYSHPITEADMYLRIASTIWDPTFQYMTARGVNTIAAGMNNAYSGCEFRDYYDLQYYFGTENTTKDYEGYVSIGDGQVVKDAIASHTGNYALAVAQNKIGFTKKINVAGNQKTKASVWVYLPGSAEGDGVDQLDNVILGYRVPGTTTLLNKPGEGQRTLSKKARSFYLLEVEIDPATLPSGTQNIEVICLNNNADRTAYFDDFRTRTVSESFSSYVYDLDRGLLTHILDNDNLYTRFEYDAMGNLVRTYQEIFAPVEKKLSAHRYNYATGQ